MKSGGIGPNAGERLNETRLRNGQVSYERPERFQLRSAADLANRGSLEWLIDDVLPAGSFVSVYGQPASGKSFLSLDLAAHVASGSSWHGKRVSQGHVVYIAAEGASGLGARVAALRLANPLLSIDALWFIEDCPALGKRGGDLLAVLDRIRAMADRFGQNPALIIIDTLAQTLAGEDENGEGMAAFIFNCQTIQAAFPGCTVLAVHHVGHRSTRPRGYSGLMGALDVAIMVKADPKTQARCACVEKMKEGLSGTQFDFRLKTVDLGRSNGGTKVTSCAVEHAFEQFAGEAKPPRRRPRTKLSTDRQFVLKVLLDLFDEHGDLPENSRSFRDHSKVVTHADWRDACYRKGFYKDASAANRRKAFSRARTAIYEDGLASESEGCVSLAGSAKA